MSTSTTSEARREIPKIRLFSWAGLESVGWGVIIAHIIKWAVSFGYYAFWQVKYPGPLSGALKPYLLWYGKDDWDRLPVHIQNLLGQHWWVVQTAPLWWLTMRHDIRDVGISLVATIIVRLIFAKPKYGYDDNPGVRVYLARIPLAIAVALVPISALGVLAWKLPWLTQHGWEVPANYGAAAAAFNEWFAAGTWITVAMGIAGGLVATKVIQRVADDIQWFWAERSAAKLRATSSFLHVGKVIGTPSHRLRVHELLDYEPDLPVRSKWLVRVMILVAVVTLMWAGAGAWLNLGGPAAVH